MNTQDLINNIQQGDAQTSNNAFNSLMADKMNRAMDIKKQDIATNMYAGNVKPVEDPTSDTDV